MMTENAKRKPWLKQPGECHDNTGLPIYAGDLLRSPHFRGRRRRQYYLYHVAVFDTTAGGLRLVPYIHLDPALRDSPDHHGGNPLLSDALAMSVTIIDGVTLRDDSGGLTLFHERPRKRQAADAAEVK